MSPSSNPPRPSETSTLVSNIDQNDPSSEQKQKWLTLGLGLSVIGCSAGLINFNKAVLADAIFPYPVALVLVHMTFATIMCNGLLLLAPSLFPSITDPRQKVEWSFQYLGGRLLPVAVAFAGQLVMSNNAYRFASVAFLQMMKEGNIILVFATCVLLGTEVFRRRQAIVLVGIFFATLATIHGEVHFSMVGFLCQAGSNVCEVSKIVMQGMLLSGVGKKLDALSYVMTVSPLCFIMVGCLAMGMQASGQPLFVMPSLEVFLSHRWLLLANAFVAFSLNVVCALFMKNGSPVAFVLVGVLKDAMVVVGSSCILLEYISWMQIVGFTGQLLLLSMYSIFKAYAHEFDAGMVEGFRKVFFGGAIEDSAFEAKKSLGSSVTSKGSHAC